MSVSALIGSSSGIVGVGVGVIKVKQPNPSLQMRMRRRRSGGVDGGVSNGVIECSSRPQKKATAHHMKTRPKKSAPWDVKRGPTVYPPLPTMPPEWTLVVDDAASVVNVAAQPPSQQY